LSETRAKLSCCSEANEMLSSDGVANQPYLSMGTRMAQIAHNALLDATSKLPGMTQSCHFIVDGP